MGPGGLPGLARGDRLELSSEVQVTVEAHQAGAAVRRASLCVRPPVVVTLELASGARIGARVEDHRPPQAQLRAAGAAATAPLPGRLRHRARVGDDFPCRLDRCFVNLIVSAHSRRARGGERIIIGANKPNGRIVQARAG